MTGLLSFCRGEYEDINLFQSNQILQKELEKSFINF